VCLIPSSAHGTNPASASMVGMEVVVVACDARGDVDVDDLRAKAEKHSKNLAAIMITYPSTHGVFEEHIRDICDIVHGHGGQVYLDGANMKRTGRAVAARRLRRRPSRISTCTRPSHSHGGGGPGMGPIGVRAHLAPYLPGHPSTDGVTPHPVGPVSAAPFGSASI
jgi:glycine dehydrogenase